MNPRRAALRVRGFTLLEVVLAVAIAGMVMTAATALLVAAGNAWLLRDERAFLETHASGVAQFLTTRTHNPRTRVQVDNTNSTSQSNARSRNGGGVRPSTGAAASGQADAEAQDGIQWRPLPGAAPADEPKLLVPLAAGHPLLLSQLAAERGIEAFIAFEAEKGLFLLWNSPLQEEAPQRPDELNRTQLSLWVTAVEYFFIDPRNDRWERTSITPYDAQNNPIIPRFIRLVFTRDGIETERMVAIPPATNGGIPLY